ncbi:hypothetical protein SARC_07740 [Sphaeroforma arctica JP610]|uniref:Uncharacterized protein n=1 Tax=Sphaeroforma arctica JP610 TaxID=667725 RepID=A0A0L0FTI7_9EUKA|nr:hypothetical protein SARC_07740 [Sphaeroforma arctica JP610]KNC79886.1 hypothetical protein SARC_07740 [Sphaeroforma arctica JP610]|eukprot:XP_014153788.1 hypothetical protein SARC_07740 [Sphaeroforma arctica JP610]
MYTPQTTISEVKHRLEAQAIALHNAIKKLDETSQSILKMVADGVKAEQTIKTATKLGVTLRDEVDTQPGKLEHMQFQMSKMATMMKETRVYIFSYGYILGTREVTRYCTGFQSVGKFGAFMTQMKSFGAKYEPGRRSGTFENAIVMWFARVRHNLEQDIQHMIFAIRRRINNRWLLPYFEVDYPNTALVIDCTEYFLETSSNLDTQRASCSNYKHHNIPE